MQVEPVLRTRVVLQKVGIRELRDRPLVVEPPRVDTEVVDAREVPVLGVPKRVPDRRRLGLESVEVGERDRDDERAALGLLPWLVLIAAYEDL